MRLRNLSQTALFSAFMCSTGIGLSFAGSTAVRAADVPTASADPGRETTVRSPQQVPTVTMGPVYAYGPILRPRNPGQNSRQRSQMPSWPNGNERNTGRNRNYQAQEARPWQGYPPRNNWNSRWVGGEYWNGNQYDRPYGGYRAPWTRPQYPNAMAWYDRPPRQNSGDNRYRQPYWQY
jgi:hypothetical protein